MAEITDQQKAASEESARAEAIRSLAQTLNPDNGGPYTQLIKGVVTSVSAFTMSAQLGGDTSTTIDGIRYFLPYLPTVGDVVQLLKQGSDIVALGKVDNTTDSGVRATENGWTVPTLATGFTHSSDQIKFRAFTSRGEKYLEIKGSCTIGSPTYTANVATMFTLPVGFRPTLNSSILLPRDSGGLCVKINFIASTGVVQIDNLKGVRTDADNAQSATTTVDMQHFHDDANYQGTSPATIVSPNTATGFAKYGTWGSGGSGSWFNGFPGGNPHSHLIPVHDHGMANTLPTAMWFTGTQIIL